MIYANLIDSYCQCNILSNRRRLNPSNRLILSTEEEQDEFDKSSAGLLRPSLSTAKATTDMPLRTARTRPQMLSDVSTTRFIQIRLELIARSLFEVYVSIQGIFNCLSLHFPLSAIDVHERESRPASESPLRELEFNTQMLINGKANPIYAPVPKGDNVPDAVLIEGIIIEDVVPASASSALTTSPVGKPPGTPRTRPKYPTTNHGNQDERWGAQIDLKYPIAKHRLQDETWGARIESFLLNMLWCSKKQATVVSLLSSLMKSKLVPSLRNIFLHRMGSDKM